MTARTSARLLSALVVAILATALGLASCLPVGNYTPPPDKCTCDGVYCLDGKITKRTPRPDNGEGDDPCLGCESKPLGVCADGCTTETFEVQGCSVAYACATWDRIKPGHVCAIDRDCEPGLGADGKPTYTLACRNNVCTDVGAEKFKDLAVGACATKTFGASAHCDGRACLGQDEYSKDYFCSAARCIDSRDCPVGWHCRCAEEGLDEGLRAWRWCVPDATASADAGQ